MERSEDGKRRVVAGPPKVEHGAGAARVIASGFIGALFGAVLGSQTVSHQPAVDKRLELAYDAAEKRLAIQLTTLGNLRTLANVALAAATLFVTISVGFGLFNTDKTKGPVLDPSHAKLLIGVLVGVLILLTTCVGTVFLPVKKWEYTPSAKKIMTKYYVFNDEALIRRYVIDEMIRGIEKNNNTLKRRFWGFRTALVLVVAEVALLLSMLT
jgi:hypothetical protein